MVREVGRRVIERGSGTERGADHLDVYVSGWGADDTERTRRGTEGRRTDAGPSQHAQDVHQEAGRRGMGKPSNILTVKTPLPQLATSLVLGGWGSGDCRPPLSVLAPGTAWSMGICIQSNDLRRAFKLNPPQPTSIQPLSTTKKHNSNRILTSAVIPMQCC